MPAKKCVTDRQWQLLLHHMEANPDFAKGMYPNLATLAVRCESRNKWHELMCKLNAMPSSCKKSERGWREYWNQAKYRSRTKACTIRKQLKAIMKGERINLLVLTKNEQRVLRLLGIPLPEFRVLDSQQDTTHPYASPPYASPPDLPLPESSTPLEESPGLAAPLKPKVEIELEESDAKSDSDSTDSSLPLIERCPQPAKLAYLRAKPEVEIEVEEYDPKSESDSRRSPLPLIEKCPPPAKLAYIRAKPKYELELKESDAKSGPISTHSPLPLIERCPPPAKLAYVRAMKRKAAYESSAPSTRVYSAPHGPTARKRHRPAAPASEWVRHVEERRIAVEERSSRALQGIQANTEYCANALQGIHIAQERMNRTLQGIQSALEASARALQERLS